MEKPEKVRSMKMVTDFHSFEHSPMDFHFKKMPSTATVNYMKPTSCSDARKRMMKSPTVTTDKKKGLRSLKNSYPLKAFSYPFTVSSPPTAVKALHRQFSLKSARSLMKKSSAMSLRARKNLNRATCSSTLKDLKFPAALVLDHGATEAEGTSKVSGCPYTYCSLNGRTCGALPPPKSFLSGKRKLLETPKNIEKLCLFSVKSCENEEEKFDKEQMHDISRTLSDKLVEMYTMPQEEIMADNSNETTIHEDKDHKRDCMLDAVVDSNENVSQMNEPLDMSLDYGYHLHQISEVSHEEMDDATLNFHEYVEIDNEIKTQEDHEFKQCREMENSDIEAMDIEWEEDQFLGNNVKSKIEEGDSGSEESSSHVTNKDDSIRSSSDLNSQVILDMIPKPEGTETTASRIREDGEGVTDAKTSPDMRNFYPLGDESDKSEKDVVVATAGTKFDVSSVDFKETGCVLSSRWNNSRKRTVEEFFEQVKEFNPRPSNFFPLEPVPEAEKVDLRHQMMDERGSSEEWMLDHALQQALAKLEGPAGKRKVAMLVKAFETVVPLNVCEKTLSHGTSAFTHLSFIQACS